MLACIHVKRVKLSTRIPQLSSMLQIRIPHQLILTLSKHHFSVDLISSASSNSYLPNGTFCLPIDDKFDKKEITKRNDDATNSTLKVGQVFKSSEECKKAINICGQTLGFVASIIEQCLVCNRSDASKNKKTTTFLKNVSNNSRKRRCNKVSLPCSCK